MMSTRNVGRVVGVLLLVQALLAIPVYTEIGMMRAVIAPDFLVGAAGSAMQIRVALLLVLVLSLISLTVALVAWPVFRPLSERMALAFLALCIIGLAVESTESHTVRSMVALSSAYADGQLYKPFLETMAANERALWRSAHFTNLMWGHLKVFFLFCILFRFALVPRLLAGLGVAATLLSTSAAILPLLGYRFFYTMIMPTGLIQLVTTLWLIVRGFADVNGSDAGRLSARAGAR